MFVGPALLADIPNGATEATMLARSAAHRLTDGAAGRFCISNANLVSRLSRHASDLIDKDTMPSKPSLQACMKTVAPSSSMCSTRCNPDSSLEQLSSACLPCLERLWPAVEPVPFEQIEGVEKHPFVVRRLCSLSKLATLASPQ
jgi:hypothetical protein